MNEKIVIIGGQENLPTHCASCGGPVKNRFHPVCQYCSNSITHAELVEEIDREKEKPVDIVQDEFADCEGSEEIDGVNTKLDSGKYESLTVSGVNNEISNVTVRELTVDGGTNTNINNCTLKKLVVNDSTDIVLNNVKIYELLRVNGTNVKGSAELAEKAKYIPNGTNVNIDVSRF